MIGEKENYRNKLKHTNKLPVLNSICSEYLQFDC